MEIRYKVRHEITLPSKILIGRNIVPELPGFIKQYFPKVKTILLFTDRTVYGIVAGRVSEMLEDSGFSVQIYYVKGSSIYDMEHAKNETGSIKPDIILAIGGGKVIDVAKYSAYHSNLGFISMPTTASHDGIASPIVALKDEERNPISLFTRPPQAIFVDTEIIRNAPYRLIASGCGDVIGKITAVRDAILARKIKGEYVGDYALNLALMAAKMVMKNAELIAAKNEEGIRVLMEALISCGVAMAIAGSSRPCSGSEHLFSHALDKVAPKPALHGEQVGVGTIMMAYLHGLKWWKIKEFLKKVRAPTNAKELGIPEEYIIEALTIAHKIRKRYTILGETGLTREAAENLARVTGVIE